jgi:staphylococcal nuclease domain-containing protein 1
MIMDPTTGDSLSLARAVAASGWATVKDSRDASRLCSDHADLVDLEAAARSSKIGMFGNPKNAITRNPNWNPTAAVIEDIYQKAVSGATAGVIRIIVESVRDGATLRVLDVKTFTYINLFMAGVICPRVGTAATASAAVNDEADNDAGDAEAQSTPATSNAVAEPFGLQAKVFTELRLLNRELDCKIFGVDSRGNALIGTIMHPKGDIAIELLKNGLGKLSERTVPFVTKYVLV